jgi:RNA polymerase sigma-70 factor (ECF subfamily)
MIDSVSFPLLNSEMMLAQSRERDSAVSMMGEEEFRLFYERTARSLWSYLSRITGSRQQADDFLQEAYYRFYRAGAKHESEAHRRNSLFQIATNLVRDAARHSSRYQDVPIDDDESSAIPATDIGTPEDRAAARTDVTRAMKHLQPVQRQLLWLAYAQGASHDEIANILGLRAISVRTLLLRARRKLATILTGGVQ